MKGFDDVIIRAQLQPVDAILFRRSCRQHQDRQSIVALSNLPGHFESIQLFQHEVENDQIERFLTMQSQRFFAAGSGAHFITFLFQIKLQRAGEIQLVFD
jgi:hypothetical protein